MKKNDNFLELKTKGVKIFNLDSDVQAQDVCASISLAGACVFQGFFSSSISNNHLKDVIEEAESLLGSTDDSSYRFGNVIRRKSSQIKDRAPCLHSAFVNPLFSEIARLYGMPHPGDIFLSHDFNSYQDRGLEVNGHLHYDKRQTLKFFLYLSDVDKSSGAFSILPGSRDQGMRWRAQDAGMNRIYTSAEYNVDSHRFGLEFLKNETLPIEGPAGTIIAFDSDTLHFGGRVERGRERKVARVHYRGSREDF